MSNSGAIDPAAAAERAGVWIRAAEPADLAAIGATMSEPAVVRNTLQTPYTANAQRAERWTFTDPNLLFVVAETPEGDVVGNASLHRSIRPRRLHTADVGMAVRSDWHGRGVGSALMAALLDVADNWWQVRRVVLEVFVDNEPAIALYRKFGFEVEGTLRADAFRDGEYVDSLLMARIRAIP